jgi:hypothetical protein
MPLFLIASRPRRPCPGPGAPPKYQTNLVPFSDTRGNHETPVGATNARIGAKRRRHRLRHQSNCCVCNGGAGGAACPAR